MTRYRDFGMFNVGRSIAMIIFMLIFVAIATLLVIALIKYLRTPTQSKQGEDKPSPFVKNDNALNILNERYAKGEISKEEFEAIKADLKK